MGTGLESIRACLRLPEGTGTSGMPRPEDFKAIAGAGYGAVINLALPTSDNAMANEGELVSREGMAYVQIPVRFDAPRAEDYERFERIMDSFRGTPVFVHCAANMRVSAFMFVYRVRKGLVGRAEGEAEMRQIWEPDSVWREYIEARLGKEK